jgi:hypothetical protein
MDGCIRHYMTIIEELQPRVQDEHNPRADTKELFILLC